MTSLDSGTPDLVDQMPPSDGPTVSFTRELETSHLRYSMSVIISRALPDARDGLKPVHRRILYAMAEAGYDAGKPHRKSARVVGDVMGKYHPHGDSSIYEAMARMAQPWSLRVPLIDGQGNFGSVDGDSPAAMRYTEARLDRAAEILLASIDEDTVDFRPNYDESEREPSVLPAGIPNMLINGSEGIAVGMATKIPPHNPREAITACETLVRDPNVSLDELMEIMPGPDFPTGASIMGTAGIRSAYETGRGSITIRGKAEIETIKAKRGAGERQLIVITELPYQVNKATLVERIDGLSEPIVQKGGPTLPPPIPGISLVQDESDRTGMRVVVELTKDADPNAVLASLYRLTNLQITFGINMLAIAEGRPEQMGLKRSLEIFIAHRREVIRRRSEFRLAKNRTKLHLQAGFLAALDSLDLVVATIRASADQPAARAALRALRFPISGLLAQVVPLDPRAEVIRTGETPELSLTEDQARAILELRLSRLTGMDREEVAVEAKELAANIEDLLRILNERARADEVLLSELGTAKAGIKNTVGERRTVIEAMGPEGSTSLDTVPRLDVLVTLTSDNYVKSVPLSAFRTQRRGGSGKAATRPGEAQAVTQTLQCTTHAQLLVFTAKGMCYAIPVHHLPSTDPRGRGRAIVNFCEHLEDQSISAILVREPDADAATSLLFVFSSGDIRRSASADFASVKSNGKIAAKFEDGDDTTLVAVMPAGEDDDAMLFTAGGSAIRFPVVDLRIVGSRESLGVRGISLGSQDRVVGATVVPHGKATPDERAAWNSSNRESLSDERKAELGETERFVLTISQNGVGKRSSTHHFPITGRGGKGVAAAKLSPETGPLVAAIPLADEDDLMVTTAKGVVIRQRGDGVTQLRRDTRGVSLIRLDKGDSVHSVMRLDREEEEAAEEDGGSSANAPAGPQA